MSVASRIECVCDLKLMTNDVRSIELQTTFGHAPIEVFESLALFEL